MSKGDRVNTAQVTRMLTVSEVALLLHVHPNTVRLWSDRGLLKAYRLGYRRDRRFRSQDIDEYLSSNRYLN